LRIGAADRSGLRRSVVLHCGHAYHRFAKSLDCVVSDEELSAVR